MNKSGSKSIWPFQYDCYKSKAFNWANKTDEEREAPLKLLKTKPSNDKKETYKELEAQVREYSLSKESYKKRETQIKVVEPEFMSFLIRILQPWISPNH